MKSVIFCSVFHFVTGRQVETTSLHLDVLRDLRRIHSHICSVAYPVLDAAGELPALKNAENDLVTLPAPAATP
jgi:phosphate:Na+ symporter